MERVVGLRPITAWREPRRRGRRVGEEVADEAWMRAAMSRDGKDGKSAMAPFARLRIRFFGTVFFSRRFFQILLEFLAIGANAYIH